MSAFALLAPGCKLPEGILAEHFSQYAHPTNLQRESDLFTVSETIKDVIVKEGYALKLHMGLQHGRGPGERDAGQSPVTDRPSAPPPAG